MRANIFPLVYLLCNKRVAHRCSVLSQTVTVGYSPLNCNYNMGLVVIRAWVCDYHAPFSHFTLYDLNFG